MFQRPLRDMVADTYIAERLGYPPGSDPKRKSIWELSFLIDSYVDVSKSANLEAYEPARLWVKIPVRRILSSCCSI